MTFWDLKGLFCLKSARVGGGTAMSFAVIYSIFVTAAWFANKEWYYLYRYVCS